MNIADHSPQDPKCKECIDQYPRPCSCVRHGWIHAEVSAETDNGDVWLEFRCDECGIAYEEVDAARELATDGTGPT